MKYKYPWKCIPFSVLTISLLIIGSCKKKDIEPISNNPDTVTVNEIDKFVSELTKPNLSENISEPQELSRIETWNADGSEYCVAKKYKYGPYFSEGVLLNPTSNIIFPGAILDGNSIQSGAFTLVSLPRTGGTLSLDLASVDSTIAKVDETVKSEVQQAITGLVKQESTGSTASEITFALTEMKSETQFDIAASLKVGIKEKINVTTAFDFSSSNTLNQFLLEFAQVYYKVSYDPKAKPSDYFQKSVTKADLQNYIKGGLTPVYVSEVKYGRIAYYAIQTKLSRSELQASLSASYSGATANVQGEIELRNKLASSETKISGTIIGGSATDAVKAVNSVDGMLEFINNGGDFSPTSPGSPIGYILSSLYNNSVFTVQRVDQFTVEQCRTIQDDIQLVSMKHISGGQEDILKGKISYQIGYDDTGETSTTPTLWSSSVRNYLSKDGTVKDLVNVTNPTLASSLGYDGQRFDKTYILVTVDMTNEYDWTVGSGKGFESGTITSSLKKSYKIYLNQIKTFATLNSLDWSTLDGEIFNLKIVFDGKSESIRHCKNTNGPCLYDSNFTNTTVYKDSATLELGFLINVEGILN